MLRKLFHRLRAGLRRRNVEREMDRELQFHLEMETAKNMRRGMSEEEAQQAALRDFGGVEQVKERYRDISRFRRLEEFWQDLRYGARMLLKRPGFTFVAGLALAVGIGANTAIFSVVNAVLLKPLPYYDPQRLVWISETWPNRNAEFVLSPDYIEWRAQSRAFEHLVAFGESAVNLTGRGESERLACVYSTANLFPALGVAPVVGRAFTPEEDRPGAAAVALLSHRLWLRRFGGDPKIVGQSLAIGGESYLVIGVMPAGFQFSREAELWLPLRLNAEQELRRERMSVVNVVGRLKANSSIDRAQEELNLIARRIDQANPGQWPGAQVRVTPLGERLAGDLRRPLQALFGAVALVLLIACANVANLLLARSAARQKEMAIRAAMGAGRWRLIRQTFTESLLLSALGGVAGLLLAVLGVRALVALSPDNLARFRESGVDGAVLGFTLVVSLLTGVVAGMVPALQISHVNLSDALKEGWGAGGNAAAPLRRGMRRAMPALVIGELALTLALLAGAGLLIKSFLRLRAVELGYDPENVLTMMIQLNSSKYPSGAPQQKAYYQELLARVKALPGVEGAAISTGLPFTGISGRAPLTIEGRPPVHDSQKPLMEMNEISHDYFRAMGMRLRVGRAFTERDDETAQPVAIINETLARRYFPGEDPLGKRILFGPRAWTIVGVAPDVRRYGLEEEVRPEFYRPYLQETGILGFVPVKLEVRAVGDSLNLAAAVRRQALAIDPDQPVFSMRTMERRLAESIAPRRFQMTLFGVFAAVALALAAVGIYGVIAHSVSLRTHEIGIRMALGAKPRDVLRMVVAQGMRLALIGLAIGLTGAFALTRVMASLLFSVSPTDPATFASVSALLAMIAFLATYLPARRATKVDPMIALRHE
ncbi:MAG: ABC transporter permease [Blastocatellia bacterium]|nr:ABC transporter permease [Blastocatellia bacterium]